MSASFLEVAESRAAAATLPASGDSAPDARAASPPVEFCFTETFAETEKVHFQLILLGGATYVWIGTDEGRQDSLAMGVPSTKGPPAAGTTLIGGGTISDAASQAMAQRLARKLGRSVFVSSNLRDDGELRMFAERTVIAALRRTATPEASKPPALASPALPPPMSIAALPPLPSSNGGSGGGGGGGVDRAVTSRLAGGSAADDAAGGARVFEVFESATALGAAGARIILDAARVRNCT